MVVGVLGGHWLVPMRSITMKITTSAAKTAPAT
jgi:hypothetical protein